MYKKKKHQSFERWEDFIISVNYVIRQCFDSHKREHSVTNYGDDFSNYGKIAYKLSQLDLGKSARTSTAWDKYHKPKDWTINTEHSLHENEITFLNAYHSSWKWWSDPCTGMFGTVLESIRQHGYLGSHLHRCYKHDWGIILQNFFHSECLFEVTVSYQKKCQRSQTDITSFKQNHELCQFLVISSSAFSKELWHGPSKQQ